MERPSVTVVICVNATERVPVLRSAVAAVLEQVSSTDELIVVVDHNPGLLEFLSDGFEWHGARSPSEPVPTRVLPNKNQTGLSGARNAGVAAAHCDLVVFLDDDAIPRPGWLAELVEPFADSAVIGTGGTATPKWVSEPKSWFPDEFLWVVGCSFKGLPSQSTQVRNPIGANMAFRREVILEAGGFTDGLGRVGRTPLGCEETEFSIRATRTVGGRIIQRPAAIVDHVIPDSRLSARYFIRRCWAEGISKAKVSRLAGSAAALETERAYATRTLPVGLMVGLRDGIAGRPAGFARSAAILGGFGITLVGYLRGSVSREP